MRLRRVNAEVCWEGSIHLAFWQVLGCDLVSLSGRFVGCALVSVLGRTLGWSIPSLLIIVLHSPETQRKQNKQMATDMSTNY